MVHVVWISWLAHSRTSGFTLTRLDVSTAMVAPGIGMFQVITLAPGMAGGFGNESDG